MLLRDILHVRQSMFASPTTMAMTSTFRLANDAIRALRHRTSLLLAFLFLVSSASSQVRFTSANNPVPGESTTYDRASAQGFNPGASGFNATWDFSDIARLSPTTRSVILRSQLPNAIQTAFPTATFAIVDDTTTYLYAPSARTIRVIGIVTPRTVTNVAEPNNPYETRPTEFTQNQRHIDQFVGSVFYPTSQGTTVATATTTFDAVGTLTLNNAAGPIPDVKRTVTRIVRSDEFVVNNRTLLQQTVTVCYSWYPERGSLPIAEYMLDTIRLFSGGRQVAPPVIRERLLLGDGRIPTSVSDERLAPSASPLMLRVGQLLPPDLTAPHQLSVVSTNGTLCATIDASAPYMPNVPSGVYAIIAPSAGHPVRRIVLVAP